ncbi:MAG TPA: Rieske 2Fe-2S domain-containing protein [Terriglobales bacterium]|nr:Rieske 2Fe-2S domain-containing protein [Terriglobales bacterium]
MSELLTQPELKPAEAAAKADWLYGFWYPALRSERVRGMQMAKAMLLGIPLVLGRKRTGEPFAMRDSCPHRGIPLSYGQFDGERVQCSYHGWCFEPRSGQCLEIPSLTSHDKLKVDRIFASAFLCEERDGFFWVFMPEPGSGRMAANAESPSAAEAAPFSAASSARPFKADLPPVPRVPTFSDKYVLTHLAAELPCSVDHGIIGLMDPAHGPFVHQSWWWRSRHSIHEKEKHFEPIPNGFRMSAHAPSANSAPYKLMRLSGAKAGEKVETTIDFVLPNLRFETVRCGEGWFSTLTTVTPVTANHCRIDVRAAWNIFRWATPLVLPIGRFFGKKFIRQDQQTMEQQAEGLKHNPNLMLIDDADRPAKWYFALKQAYLEARRNGREMQHPMSGPVTLHWRS